MRTVKYAFIAIVILSFWFTYHEPEEKYFTKPQPIPPQGNRFTGYDWATDTITYEPNIPKVYAPPIPIKDSSVLKYEIIETNSNY